jgi:hypothetical protein
MELASELEQDGIDYIPGDIETRSALAIARHMVRTPSLVDARERLKNFGPMYPNPNRVQIIKSLCPLAFEPDVAALLTRRTSSGRYADSYIETVRPNFTIDQCVRRAHLALEPPKVYPLINANHSIESLQDELREEWRANNMSMSEGLTDADVDTVLANLQVYVAIPGPLDAEVLDALRVKYPKLTFVIHHRPTDPASVLPDGVLPLVPPLEREEEIFSDHLLALTNLG